MKEVFGFRLSQTIEGVGLEAGVHFIPETSEKRRVAVSLYYLYHRAEAEMNLPLYPVKDSRLLRSITLEASLAHYFGAAGVVIGPRLTLDWDLSNPFVGVHSAFLLRH